MSPEQRQKEPTNLKDEHGSKIKTSGQIKYKQSSAYDQCYSFIHLGWKQTFGSRRPDWSRGGREALWLRVLEVGGAEASRLRFLATLRDRRACWA